MGSVYYVALYKLNVGISLQKALTKYYDVRKYLGRKS